MRVLDVGCGWGPILKWVQDQGGEAVGLTLSPKQAAYCQRNGLAVCVKDWRKASIAGLGPFDAVVSVGAFEHFVSKEEFLAGEQDRVYERFFSFCSSLLQPRSRLFLQTMVFGRHMPPHQRISLDAPRGSSEHLLALLEKSYLGAWLPDGREQVERTARGFRLVAAKNGREDYIRTIRAWGNRHRRVTPGVLLALIRAVPAYLTSSYFRDEVRAINSRANLVMFEREVFDHWRLLFEKV